MRVNTHKHTHSNLKRGKKERSELSVQTANIMETPTERRWFLVYLYCFLVGSLVDSSSLSSSTNLLTITSTVGNKAVLPCSWKSRLGEAGPSTCHIQWTTPAETVFELRGEQMWQAEEYKGRMEVPEEKLGSGDCSLIINDAQIGDTGRYESFMVVDGARSKKTRVFIQSVKLSVFDHKSLQSKGPGEDLVLNLHTSHSLRVVFQGSNSSEWLLLWMRGDEDTERLQKHPLKEQLTVKMLKNSDAGTYKVLDEHGLSVSTVLLSVEESSTAAKVHPFWENQVSEGDAAKSSSSALLISFVLIASFQLVHLL